jgi:hypothetical protein
VERLPKLFAGALVGVEEAVLTAGLSFLSAVPDHWSGGDKARAGGAARKLAEGRCPSAIRATVAKALEQGEGEFSVHGRIYIRRARQGLPSCGCYQGRNASRSGKVHRYFKSSLHAGELRAAEPAKQSTKPALADSAHLLADRNRIKGETSSSRSQSHMAGVNPCFVRVVSQRNNYDHRAAPVGGIPAQDDDRQGATLF